jgi:hypothetical protein
MTVSWCFKPLQQPLLDWEKQDIVRSYVCCYDLSAVVQAALSIRESVMHIRHKRVEPWPFPHVVFYPEVQPKIFYSRLYRLYNLDGLQGAAYSSSISVNFLSIRYLRKEREAPSLRIFWT